MKYHDLAVGVKLAWPHRSLSYSPNHRLAPANYDDAMIEELGTDDVLAVTSLWEEVGLTRPWNDPESDYRRAHQGLTSAVLGLKESGTLIGTVMVGHDGHRGWVYYLAVRPDHQRKGFGGELMSAAEVWLRHRGAVKIQLMVRSENQATRQFYEQAGYEKSDVTVLARWLNS
jgi:ribosomal protein S18 acetylase RimI-like enzyme